MLSSLSHPEVDTTCFSCTSPDLNSLKLNPWLWRPQNSFHLIKPMSHATPSIKCGFLSYSLPKVNSIHTNKSFPSTPRLVGVTHVLDNMHAYNQRKDNWQHGLSSDSSPSRLKVLKECVYICSFTHAVLCNYISVRSHMRYYEINLAMRQRKCRNKLTTCLNLHRPILYLELNVVFKESNVSFTRSYAVFPKQSEIQDTLAGYVILQRMNSVNRKDVTDLRNLQCPPQLW